MGETVWITAAPDAARGSLRGYLALPSQGTAPRGGVVVVQEIFGVNNHVRAVADGFAAQGYAVLAPLLFDLVQEPSAAAHDAPAPSGDLPPVELDYDEHGISRGRALTAALGFDRAVAAVAAAAATLGPYGKVGVVGFCWGGTVALLSCTRLGLPAVDYYGGRSVPFLHERAQAPLLLHFGERDHIIPPEHVQQHRLQQPQAELHVYPAGHGFNCDQRADFEPASAALAMQRTLAFLSRHLQAGP